MSDFHNELPDEAPGEAPLFLTDLPELHEHFACLAEEVDESSPTDATEARALLAAEASARVFASLANGDDISCTDFPELNEQLACHAEEVDESSPTDDTPAAGSRERYTDDENREIVDEAATAVAPFANDSLNQCSPEELHCNFFFAVPTSLGIPGIDFPRELSDEEPWEAPSFTASERYYTPSALDEYTELCFASLEPSPDG